MSHTDHEIKLLQSYIGDRRIPHYHLTEFVIQVSRSRNHKSGYVIRHVVTDNLHRAVMLYDMTAVANGYRKRLIIPNGFNRPTLPTVILRCAS